MKASPCTSACATRLLTLMTASVLLVQCSMPPQQAWRYIQTNGLLTYWNAPRPSPPLRAPSSGSQRYVQQSTPYASRLSTWNSGLPSRSHYGSTYSPNSYLATPSPTSSSSRYTPRSRSSSRSNDRTPSVKMPVEEPASTPQFAHSTPPVSSTPKTHNHDAPATDAAADLPYGSAIPGRINMVNSPYAGKTQLVDVSGMSAGQTVKCPYTGKLFKVPPTQEAANHAEPRLESKAEAPKLSEEPKTGDKQP